VTYTGKCGHPVSKAGVEKCRKCWRARGEDVSPEEKRHIGKCGHEVSTPRHEFCRSCYDIHRLRLDQIAPAPEPLSPLLSFEAAWQQWQKAIGMAKDRYRGPKAGRNLPKSGTQKILVVPDVHAPFHEEQMFADMLEREADADKVICIGDLSDSYALSTYTHYRRMPFAEEWASVTLVMQALSERFPSVEVVIGNHDARLEKRIRERLSEDMVDAVKYLTGGILCPITALARRYPNVTVAKHQVPNGDSVDWFTTCGDAWLGHPEKYSRVPGAALRFLEDWLADREYELGLDRYRLIVMGHTHTHSHFPWRGRQLLVETGCLCQTQGYMLKPKIGGRPQIRGYLTFKQTDGRTDLNSVRFHWFDAEEQVA
jgi:predicted phosphodiesterase